MLRSVCSPQQTLQHYGGFGWKSVNSEVSLSPSSVSSSSSGGNVCKLETVQNLYCCRNLKIDKTQTVKIRIIFLFTTITWNCSAFLNARPAFLYLTQFHQQKDEGRSSQEERGGGQERNYHFSVSTLALAFLVALGMINRPEVQLRPSILYFNVSSLRNYEMKMLMLWCLQRTHFNFRSGTF